MHVLKWAHEQGCQWDEETCNHAAANGHLNILEWAFNNGCPLNNNTCKAAATGGHPDILEWMMDTDHQIEYNRVFAIAARCGQYDVFTWALQLNRPWTNEVYKLTEAGRSDIISKFESEDGYSCKERLNSCKKYQQYLAIDKCARHHSVPEYDKIDGDTDSENDYIFMENGWERGAGKYGCDSDEFDSDYDM